LCVGCVPHFYGVVIAGDDVLEMGCQGCAIDCGTRAWQPDSLGDVEDDGCEAIFIEIDFLVVRDLSDCAEFESQLQFLEDGEEVAHLTSAKLLGRSTIRAPPKSGVLVKDAIVSCDCVCLWSQKKGLSRG